MPTDADKWEQDMIDKGLMKDKDGYYHYTLKKNEDADDELARLCLTKLLDYDII